MPPLPHACHGFPSEMSLSVFPAEQATCPDFPKKLSSSNLPLPSAAPQEPSATITQVNTMQGGFGKVLCVTKHGLLLNRQRLLLSQRGIYPGLA